MHRSTGTILAVAFYLALGGCTLNSEPTATPEPPVAYAPTATSGTLIDQPIEAAEQYLLGMQSYDAQMMWDAYSTTGQQNLATQGGSVAVLQERLDEWKNESFRIERWVRIGTYLLPNGGAYAFYVAIGQSPTSQGPGEVYYVFTVDREGKIEKVQ
jgi:hypothetical protein